MTCKETHLLAYLTWNRVVPWKVLALKGRKKKLFPFAYGSSQRILCKRAKEGTVLWVVTMPRLMVGESKDSRGRQVKEFSTLPPTLVARLKIESFLCERNHCSEQVAREESVGPGVAALLKHWGAVATAREKGSLFYGPNDATKFLDSLVFHSKKKTKTLKPDEKLTESKRYLSYAHRLQSIRHIDVAESRVDLGSSNPLRPQLEKTVFLSYVHNDNMKYAANLASALQAQGWYPWFDSLSMPGYRTSRRFQRAISKQEHTSRIASLIEEGIRHCAIFLSIRDEDYDSRLKQCVGGEGSGPGGVSWVRYERDLASDRKLRMGHIKLGRVKGKPHVSLGERWSNNCESPHSTAVNLSNIWWHNHAKSTDAKNRAAD